MTEHEREHPLVLGYALEHTPNDAALVVEEVIERGRALSRLNLNLAVDEDKLPVKALPDDICRAIALDVK